jgi:hypothetical protein
MHLHCLLRRLGRVLRPQRVDQSVSGHDLVRVEQEDRQKGTPFRATQLDHPAAARDLERAQHPELERAIQIHTGTLARPRLRFKGPLAPVNPRVTTQ